MSNPFNITFGELPKSIVKRENDIEKIEKTFEDETPESKVYLITGPRGSGKTVLLTTIKKDLKNKGYLTVDLNPYEELQEQFASKLYDVGKLNHLFMHPEFSFSFHGLTLSIEGTTLLSNVSVLIEKMLSYLEKKNKRILIVIDDVSSTSHLKSFVYFYQQLIREGYPIFLLMSGLYENVSKLESSKSLTFFLRAPKLYLDPLNLITVAYSYQSLLNISQVEAIKYAKLTNGYAYAYQLLGSLLYNKENENNIINIYEQKLNENAYSIIWKELSKKEKDILLMSLNDISQKEMCEKLKITNGSLQIYKKRLVNKGILLNEVRGELTYALPRFKHFLKLQSLFNEEYDYSD